VPLMKSLKAPIAGPHQTWKSRARSVSPRLAQPDDLLRYQRKTSAIFDLGSFSARAIFSGSLSCSSVNLTVSSQTALMGLRKVCFSSRERTSAGMASSDGYWTKSS